MRDVAVLVACHDYGRYLDECLRSVLNQTLLPAETVVVTDACSDESAEIARALIPEFALASVRYTVSDSSSARPGQSRAKNRALALSTAPLVFFLDADNVLRSDCLETGVSAMAPSVGFVYSDRLGFDDTGAEWLLPSAPVSDRILTSPYIDGNMLSRRDAFGRYDPALVLLTDWDRVLHMLAARWLGRYVNEPLVRYRVHDQNTSRVFHAHRQDIEAAIRTKYAGRPGLQATRWTQTVTARVSSASP